MTNDIEPFSVFISFFGEVSQTFFYLQVVSILLLLSFESSLYILDTSALLDM
jgi:hypothetical protein